MVKYFFNISLILPLQLLLHINSNNDTCYLSARVAKFVATDFDQLWPSSLPLLQKFFGFGEL